jgi:hypothetical protein
MMKDFVDDRGDGAGGGFHVHIYLTCHGCGRSELQEEVQRSWLCWMLVPSKSGVEMQTQLCPKCARWHLRYWIRVRWRLRIGRLSDWLAPGYSHCMRCRTNWQFCEGHTTIVSENGGMFPLCEQCWRELAPHERLKYYGELYSEWAASGPSPHDWESIKTAVLRGG